MQGLNHQRFHLPRILMVTVLLTDLYQITMAYAYWKADKHKDHAV